MARGNNGRVYYKSHDLVTSIDPGMVWWDINTSRWRFNIIVDGIAVKSSALFERAGDCKMTMREEVDRLRAELKPKPTTRGE